MALLSLQITDFRNVAGARLDFSPYLNVIVGNNGAGKTSLLEAVFVLGRGRSFRTRRTERLIREGAAHFTLIGRVAGADGAVTTVGMERSARERRVRLGGEPLGSVAELVDLLPIQLINPDSHKLLEEGPKFRRRFLDWGVFHVEQSFFPLWQRYVRILRQRNAALRARGAAGVIGVWDGELAAAAGALDGLRTAYLAELAPVAEAIASELLGGNGLSLRYLPGQPSGRTLQELLKDGLERDRALRYTRYGPHRADVAIEWGGAPAQERVSRGQQKQLVIALQLAQARLFSNRTGRPTLFLVDDLPAELDPEHRRRVMTALRALPAQVFVTAIEAEALDLGLWASRSMFHVEHGQVTEMV